ncbi:hypothetical protein M5X17_31375 [Paenibacillus alvei]|uniref:hypothetical protein n=1 Tax=Paenibacillus alvei TaxID=44250 RepID=UPI0022832362|nr:hypothetical protein [Paenibacillus alvei]MCY9738196.1 hypothetical protein [Paenibacillus alvei]
MAKQNVYIRPNKDQKIIDEIAKVDNVSDHLRDLIYDGLALRSIIDQLAANPNQLPPELLSRQYRRQMEILEEKAAAPVVVSQSPTIAQTQTTERRRDKPKATVIDYTDSVPSVTPTKDALDEKFDKLLG